MFQFLPIPLFFVVVVGCTTPSATGYDVQLTSLDGSKGVIRTPETRMYKVLLFLNTECPLCISYTPLLRTMREEYAAISTWALVFPGKWQNKDSIASYLERYGLGPNEIWRDPANDLVKLLEARVTPSAFVLDHEGTVLYSGRIDNWMYETGRKKLSADIHDLADALNRLRSGQLPKVQRTEPVGCLIE